MSKFLKNVQLIVHFKIHSRLKSCDDMIVKFLQRDCAAWIRMGGYVSKPESLE